MDDNAKEISLPTTRDVAAEDERLVQDCLKGDERAAFVREKMEELEQSTRK